MSFESSGDLEAFFNVDDFATTAIITPASGAQDYALNGIFDNEYLPVSAGDIQISSRGPQFSCAEADLQDLATGGDDGDFILINDIEYRVLDAEPDGTGVTTLILMKV